MTNKLTFETEGISSTEALAPRIINGMREVTNHKDRKELRPVAADLEACLDGKGDFYHPKYGWIRAYGNIERDTPEIIAGYSQEETD